MAAIAISGVDDRRRAAHLADMDARIIDLQARRARRQQHEEEDPGGIDGQPPPRRPGSVPQPGGSSTRPDPWAEPPGRSPSSSRRPAVVALGPSDGIARLRQDPYLVERTFERRRELTGLLDRFADDYRDGFGSSIEHAMRWVADIEDRFSSLLPSLREQRAQRLAGEAACRIVAAGHHGRDRHPVLDRIVSEAIGEDQKARKRADRRSRRPK